jgi:hypothetical protein
MCLRVRENAQKCIRVQNIAEHLGKFWAKTKKDPPPDSANPNRREAGG